MKGGVVQISQAVSIALHGWRIAAFLAETMSVWGALRDESGSETQCGKVFQRLVKVDL